MSTQRIHIGGYVDDDTALETSRSPALAMLDAIALPIRQMLARFIHERALRRAEKELMALDDRMLRDIGLSRSEIASAVRNPGEDRLNGARSPMSYPF
jgi:uncharacterized protein YjiS (DUF1127 family)